jgi:hypothetical protein
MRHRFQIKTGAVLSFGIVDIRLPTFEPLSNTGLYRFARMYIAGIVDAMLAEIGIGRPGFLVQGHSAGMAKLLHFSPPCLIRLKQMLYN